MLLEVALTFRFEGELTRGGLEAARNQLDALLGELPQDPEIARSGDPSAAADQTARELYNNLGHETWRLLHTSADRFEAKQEFTLADLADALNTPIETVRAWHRAASKVINRVSPEAPVLDHYWDGKRQQYWLEPEMRRAILALGE